MIEPTNAPSFRSTTIRARFVLAVWLGSIALCVAVALSNDPSPEFVPAAAASSDLDVFERIVNRVHAGEGFYPATQIELRTGGYPTRSVFNWRTPTYAWFLAALPSLEWGRAILALLAAASVVMVVSDMLRDRGLPDAALGGIAFVGAIAWSFGARACLLTEVWAGTLLVLSVCGLRRGWTAFGVVAGLSALFFRELALPYVVVALGLAAWSGRRREATAWAFGLLLYLGFMIAHALAVFSRITAVDQAIEGGWVRFGGLRFLLSTAQTNLLLMPVPLWWTGIYLPLAVLGLAFWGGETGRLVGLTVALYLAAFAVVGATFNFYWGFLDSPLVALGLAHAPSALRALFAEATGASRRLGSALESEPCRAPAIAPHPIDS